MTLMLGGHRGFGCTDADFFADRRDIPRLPVENTLESVARAFAEGADFIETDAVMSKDGTLFCLHNIVPADHFFAPPLPATTLDLIDWSNIRERPVGRARTGRIATLDEMLALIARDAPEESAYAVNIELKGNQGALRPPEGDAYFDAVADIALTSNLEAERILFSSFALNNIIEMGKRVPGARFGLLFRGGPHPAPIHPGGEQDALRQYLPFSLAQVAAAAETFRRETRGCPRLDYLHPEIRTLSNEDFITLGQKGYGFNTWGYEETLTEQRRTRYLELASLAEAHAIDIGFITDYLPELRALLGR